ncbi:MAG: tRNA pseudouridine(38-40) synthase TruA [Deferribacteraceae bacterium]|jgi:tRNA pseudouridine38-40 synthase|nr:tRNA pseudouridine(38-40) synthase TruA [Deferribacteraceae bacterium]
MYHKKCVCEYDGSRYSGWQSQIGGNSIQQKIEAALYKLYGEKINIIGSGRTDAGVHALGQVFSFRSEIYRENKAVVFALNTTLPRDIGILSSEDAPEGFHAQFDAKNKTYLYRILNRPARAALDADRVWFRWDNIDAARLNQLLSVLKGSYDFTSFCAAESIKENMVRTINALTAERSGEYINIRINADCFLHNMVRIIVGTAVMLTVKGEDESCMFKILSSKNRTAAGLTAPPYGLYLEKVNY